MKRFQLFISAKRGLFDGVGEGPIYHYVLFDFRFLEPRQSPDFEFVFFSFIDMFHTFYKFTQNVAKASKVGARTFLSKIITEHTDFHVKLTTPYELVPKQNYIVWIFIMFLKSRKPQ